MLAGGKAEDPLAKRFAVPAKTLVPYRGRPLVEYTLEPLAQAGLGLIYVGPQVRLSPQPRVCLPDQGGMLENLEAALPAAQGEKVLVSTGDMPFLTAPAVQYVLEHAPSAGLVYCAVPKEAIEGRFPNMRRTYARLREGSFTGGNLILLDKALFATAHPLAKKAVALRKNPLALAQMIGLGTVVKFIWGSLTIGDLEQRVSRILGLPARALIVPYAEIGVDLDKEEDLVWLE